MPSPPRGLKGDALKEWERIAPEMERDNKVRVIDQQMVAMYCRAIAFASEASREIEKRGVVVPGERGPDTTVKNPALQVFRDMMSTASNLAKPLGITPEGRARLKVDESEPSHDDDGFND
jgi:P27 family predicted phage terminase small subunit